MMLLGEETVETYGRYSHVMAGMLKGAQSGALSPLFPVTPIVAGPQKEVDEPTTAIANAGGFSSTGSRGSCI